jgi:hypothetical protein
VNEREREREREEGRERTSDWDAHVRAMLIEYGDVDIGREVSPIEFWNEIGVHVKGVCVDIEFVTDIERSQSGKGHVYARTRRAYFPIAMTS